MAKESGLGMSCTIDDSGGTGRDVSNDITNLDFATPRGVQDVTGIDSSAMERLLLLADGTVNITGGFNDATNQLFDVVKNAGSTSVTRTVTLVHSGQTLEMEMVLTDQQWSRAASGEITVTAPFALNETTVPTWT